MTQLLITIYSILSNIIYVWGASGQNVYLQMADPESWIKQEETSTANANRAIKLFRTKKADGVFPIYAMDCSGFVCYVLKLLGILKPTARYNTKGLYSLCQAHPAREDLRQGDLVFHAWTPGDASTIHHVGIYLGDGNVAESRGRDAGGCVTAFDDHPADWAESWNMYGRLSKMAPFTDAEPVAPLPLDVVKPVHAGTGYVAMQMALNECGYTDADGNALFVDGKWGGKSRAAWDKAVSANLGPVTGDVTLRIPGGGEYNLVIKEE